MDIQIECVEALAILVIRKGTKVKTATDNRNLGDKSSKGKKTVWQKGYPARPLVTSNGNQMGAGMTAAY